MERIDLYLQQLSEERYNNSDKENEMVTKVATLYSMAKSVRDGISYVSPSNLVKWRKAYLGTLNALDKKNRGRKPTESRNNYANLFMS